MPLLHIKVVAKHKEKLMTEKEKRARQSAQGPSSP
jgi:hypothetical protein